MRLSMWMLAEYLKEYNPKILIQEGKQTIRNVRVFSAGQPIQQSNVYVGWADESAPIEKRQVICVHGHDMLLLPTDQLEEVFNDILNAFDYYNSWSDNYFDHPEEFETLQSLLDYSQEVIDDPIVIYDSGMVAQAHSSEMLFPSGTGDEEWDSVLQTGNNKLVSIDVHQRELREFRLRKEAFEAKFSTINGTGYWKNVYLDHEHSGHIFVIIKQHPYSEGRRQIIDAFGEMVEAWLKRRVGDAHTATMQKLLVPLLDGVPSPDVEYLHYFRIEGWKNDDAKRLLQVFSTDKTSPVLKPLANTLRRNLSQCFIAVYKETVTILLDEEVTPLKSVLGILKDSLYSSNCYAVVSYPFTSVFDAADTVHQCLIVNEHCDRASRNIYFCQDYATVYIRNTLQAAINRSMVHPELLKLLEYDEEKQTQLTQTLYQFLLHERNLIKTAEEMHIHRNTLVYRIKRIGEIIQVNLDDPETRQYLMVSFLVLLGTVPKSCSKFPNDFII